MAREKHWYGHKKGTAMAKPRGRPKSTNPHHICVKCMMTQQQHDALLRVAGTGTVSQAIRTAITEYIWRRGGGRNLPDTERALISRERRKAKRAAQTEDSALVENFALEEPAADAHDGESQVVERPTGERIAKATIEYRTVGGGVVRPRVEIKSYDPGQRGPEQQPPR
jgi:hypothetical protein